MTEQNVPAGWYPDGSGRRRWWDGVQWTEHFEPPPAPPAPAPPAPPATAPAQTATATGPDTLAIASYVACALALVGSIGPWTTVFGLSVAGTEGDGVITLVCAVLAAATVLLTVNGGAKPRFGVQWITIVLGLVIAAVAIIDISDISSVDAASPAWGIWLVLVSGCVLTVTGVLLALRARR
jgi:hypothetical protein